MHTKTVYPDPEQCHAGHRGPEVPAGSDRSRRREKIPERSAAEVDEPSEPAAIEGRFFPAVGDDRRIVVLDSATHAPRHGDAGALGQRREVVVNASYAGVYCARLLRELDPAAVIGIDCGIGKDGAGIAGLWYFDALGVPAAAAGIDTVELGNGADLWSCGIVSRVNATAAALGVIPGTSVAAAAETFLGAPLELPPIDPHNRRVVYDPGNGHRVVATNSIADALPEDRDTNVLCTAGHSGRSVIDYIVGFRPYGYICSDGAVGKNNSGLAALDPTNTAGIPGAAVSAASARMGDGLSTYQDGVISAANALAVQAGVEVGMTAREAAEILADRFAP
jgi:hypothetical protein